MVPAKKMERIASNVRKECKCSGIGCSICASKIGRMRGYAKAGIPIVYWNLPFKNFQGDPRFGESIRSILRDINGFYDAGKSYAFIGNLGTGKSYAACCILKTAVVAGYDVTYKNMSEIIGSSIGNSEEFIVDLINTDILCIDEYDSRWIFPSEKSERLFGQVMERILRSRFENGLPTILCSNTIEIKNVLSEDYSRSTDSLFSGYLEQLYVTGKDFRKK